MSLASFLDKIATNYPYGVPQSALVSETAPLTKDCVFVLIDPDSSVEEEYGGLLTAICTKGLRYERSACDVRVMPAWTASPGDESTALAVVLGSDKTPGSIEASANKRILFSHSIRLIASEAGLKREFWGHLQALLRG